MKGAILFLSLSLSLVFLHLCVFSKYFLFISLVGLYFFLSLFFFPIKCQIKYSRVAIS